MSSESVASVLAHRVDGAGEPVLLLNGGMMTISTWDAIAAALATTHRAVRCDFRGQLLSPGVPEPMIAAHVADVVALLDHLAIACAHVVGTSFGGEVGLIFAARFPERVRSLTVIASVAHLEPRLRLQTDLWAETALRDPQRTYRTLAVDTFSGRFLEQNAGLLEAGEARLAECPPDFLPAFARLVRAFQKLDARPLLARIASPTLVVCAEHDSLKPPHYSREIADGIQGAELVVVPDAGHAVVLEKPDVVNTLLLGFLAKHALRDTPRGALP